MIRVSQVKVPVGEEEKLFSAVVKKLKTERFEIKRIVKQSIDARDKNDLKMIYAVDVESAAEEQILRKKGNGNDIMLTKDEAYRFPYEKPEGLMVDRPVIIGAGPAGYFAALYLARAGFAPVVYERGCAVEERTKDVERFWEGGKLSANSNVSFGEGGAGTFSDGKLNTGIKDRFGRIQAVIRDFISFGAPEDIGYLAKPHIGTDELKKVLANMRAEIISLGGEVHFQSMLRKVVRKSDDSIEYEIANVREDGTVVDSFTGTTRAMILAIGHSARDTFAMLNEAGVPMEQKAFAIGLRIEHPRELINRGQYGTSERAKLLPAADYKMTYHATTGRSVYSFCMCPGGYVVNASSGPNQVVVNGMSNHERDAKNSNAAIVCSVTPQDFIDEGFGQYGVLAGAYFQQNYETRAHQLAAGRVPVQRYADFKTQTTTTTFGQVTPNIRGQYEAAPLHTVLPHYVNRSIIEGIEHYNHQLTDFALPDAILSGVETRTSSPLRILRDETLKSPFPALYPCGEGAGYAGGITSAAIDGLKVAEAVALHLTQV